MERFFARLFPKSRWFSLLELGRPWNGIITGFIAIFGMHLALQGSVDFSAAVHVFFAFTFAYIGGAALNDLFDKKVDIVNMPYRPIIAGRATEREAWLFSAVFHMLAFAFAWLAGVYAVVFVILFFLFSILYSVPPVRFVERGYLAQLDLALTVCFIPLLAGGAVSQKGLNFTNEFLITALFFTVLFSFVFLIKDFKDVVGDRIGGKKTPVVTMGPVATRAIMMVGTLIMFILSTGAFFYFLQNSLFLYASVPILVLMLIFEHSAPSMPEGSFTAMRLLLFAYLLLGLAGFSKFY